MGPGRDLARNPWICRQTRNCCKTLYQLHYATWYCFLCIRARLFINALWSPAGKGLTSWLSFVMSNLLRSCQFPIGILGQVWCLIVSIPDLCPLSYFVITKILDNNFLILKSANSTFLSLCIQ